jgi:hypothetical protein
MNIDIKNWTIKNRNSPNYKNQISFELVDININIV